MAEQKDGLSAIATIDAASLRETFKRTMIFGLPSDEADQPTFFFEREVEWDDHDRAEEPWDWTAAPTTDEQPDPVKPICAYEFHAPLGRQNATFTEVGEFNPNTLIVTFTDDEFEKAKNSSYVMVGPSTQKFYFLYFQPGVALGALDIYQVTFQAARD